MHARAIILLDHARYNIFHGLVQLGELLDAVLDDLLGPMRNLMAVVDSVSVENTGNHLTDKLLDLGRVEFGVIFEVCHYLLISNYFIN